MSNITEFALFKECVNNPLFLDKSLSKLNLAFIKDPAAIETGEAKYDIPKDTSATDTPEITSRKALRLFYMVWSGVTKCLRNQVQSQHRAIEIKDFAIFGPISETNQGRDPLDKWYANNQRNAAQKLGLSPCFVVINDDFLNEMNWEVALDQSSEKAVGSFNKMDRAEVNDLFRNKILPLNVSSIASVCITDVATVDNIVREIVCQIGELAKQGKSLRLNFKIGYMIVNSRQI